MSDDDSEKPVDKPVRLIEIPLHFHSLEAGDEQALPVGFNDTQYKVRLIRYTGHLKHLLDNPPVVTPVCCDDVDTELIFEKLDNYCWVVGEIINGIYEMSQGCRKGDK